MTETTKASELAPCPFCGGEADLMVPENDDVVLATAMCMKCYSCGQEKLTDSEAITAWNDRAPLPNEGDLVEIVYSKIARLEPNTFRQQATEIITALRPYLNDGKRVAELEAALKECLLEHGGYTIKGECERKARQALKQEGAK